ncbi:hypothetical protein CLG85_016255 [Yangia mangrovi]|uniref:Uncharacterized protein n=2 Tax=Alloyangia mangrovi TaxID=1779329 RepID=A0ABT2KNV3_9RHOB|nr:hypothetical protein [Alloyangia mangrovi]MCT4371786.1 hypothetical protein [Alloyangia mangrovi]
MADLRDLMTGAALGGALSLAALPAAAEGARTSLECDHVTACSEAGTCAAANGRVSFVLAPVDTDATGAGAYELSVDGGASMPAQAMSFAGPFLWAPALGARETLTFTSETSALWLRQTIESGTGAPPSADIDFLTCRILP